MNLPDFLPQSKTEAVSDTIAVGAVASPWWLHSISGVATDLLPILGGAWLLLQIIIKIHTTYFKRK